MQGDGTFVLGYADPPVINVAIEPKTPKLEGAEPVTPEKVKVVYVEAIEVPVDIGPKVDVISASLG